MMEATVAGNLVNPFMAFKVLKLLKIERLAKVTAKSTEAAVVAEDTNKATKGVKKAGVVAKVASEEERTAQLFKAFETNVIPEDLKYIDLNGKPGHITSVYVNEKTGEKVFSIELNINGAKQNLDVPSRLLKEFKIKVSDASKRIFNPTQADLIDSYNKSVQEYHSGKIELTENLNNSFKEEYKKVFSTTRGAKRMQQLKVLKEKYNLTANECVVVGLWTRMDLNFLLKLSRNIIGIQRVLRFSYMQT